MNLLRNTLLRFLLFLKLLSFQMLLFLTVLPCYCLDEHVIRSTVLYVDGAAATLGLIHIAGNFCVHPSIMPPLICAAHFGCQENNYNIC